MDNLIDGTVVAAVLTIVFAYVQYRVRKKDETDTINKVILAEISRLLHVLCLHRIWWAECIRDKNTQMPLIPFSMDVYNNYLKNIGDLDASYASYGVSFYGYVKFLNSLQKAQSKYVGLNKRDVFDQNYLNAISKLVKEYHNTFDSAFEEYKVGKPVMDPCCTIDSVKAPSVMGSA